MPELFIKNSYPSSSDIDNLYAAVLAIEKDALDKSLRVIAKVEIVKFDIRYFGYLLLCKQLRPDIDLMLELPLNNESYHSNFQYILIQYGTYAYLMTGEGVFKVSFGGRTFDFDLAHAAKFDTNWFLLSSQFFPLLYVNRDDQSLYRLLFEHGLDDLTAGEPLRDLPAGCAYHTLNEVLMSNITVAVRDRADPRDRHRCITDLGRLAFYQILHELKVLNIFLDQNYRSDPGKKDQALKAGHLRVRNTGGKDVYEQYQFYELLRPLLAEIGSQPLITQFIFSTIIRSDGFPHTLRPTNTERFYNQLLSAWKFTREIVDGLQELIKNITQHTVLGKGFLAGRIYKKNIAKALLESELEQLDIFADYFTAVGKKHPALFKDILELSVADLGDQGIIRKLLENSLELRKKFSGSPALYQLLQEDTDLIADGHFSLRDLLHPPGNKPLYQQTKRAIAHWGFNIFTKLVKKNDGLLFAVTDGLEKPRETAIINKQGAFDYAGGVSFGTSFQVVFPIVPSQDFEPHLPGRFLLPAETTPEDILGLEELFKVKLWNWQPDAELMPAAKRRNLVTITLPAGKVKDRADEEGLWQHLEPCVSHIQGRPGRPVVLYNLDFEEVQADSSQLIRLLSRWEDAWPQLPLMVSNLPSHLFDELIGLNKDFYEQNPSFPFWNKHSGTVFFTYTMVRGSRFYFADILWGINFDEYLVINKLISAGSFNYTSSFIEKNEQEGLLANLEPYPSTPAIFNRRVMLPLDVILESNLGMTYFEHNAKVLLENRIQPLTLIDEL